MHSRRELLKTCYGGLGLLGLAGMLGTESTCEAGGKELPKPHWPRKAKRCIFLFMQGGVSQVDSFEYKPELNRQHGKPIPQHMSVEGEIEGRLSHVHECYGSPFQFKQHGESGRPMSELFPHLAGHADRLAMIHGIETDNPNHGPSTLQVTTGSQFPGSAAVGSWITYGLGSENQEMPGFAVIQDPRGAPVNGAQVWNSGYLPASHQGTLLRSTGTPILNLASPAGITSNQQRREFDQLKWLNERHKQPFPDQDPLEARIQAYELAFRMQTQAPALMDLADEPNHMRQLYGLDHHETSTFGRQCLLARRMAESGVRFTLLIHGVQIGAHSWDDHSNVKAGMIRHSKEVDQPVAALLTDLEQRGLLDETLVVWASEMGRTPFVNGKVSETSGRDHNKYGLVMWMAGGDVRPGSTAGRTDDFGLRAAETPIPIRDVHATLLDLMGLDDDQLRFRHAGRLRQLTDIGGAVLSDIHSRL
jgi:hypothetical protein